MCPRVHPVPAAVNTPICFIMIDRARAPCRRLLETGVLEERRGELDRLYSSLDPAGLKGVIDEALEGPWKLEDNQGMPDRHVLLMHHGS